MREISVTIKVVSDQAKAALRDVDRSLEQVAKTAEKSADGGLAKVEVGLGKVAAAVGGTAALMAGLRNLTGLVGDSVRSYGEAETSLSKLTAALVSQGQATPDVINQFDKLATKFQTTTTFSDDLIREMAALLVQVGNVAPDQMERALKASTDLSKGLGIDLKTATLAVAKSFDGGGQAIGRLLPSLRDLIKDGASTNDVLAAINQRFGNQAQAALNTYSGKVQNLTNRWSDFQERIGNVIVNVMDPLLGFFEAMPQWLQATAFAIGAVTLVAGPMLAGFASLAAVLAPAVLPALIAGMGAALTVLAGPAGAIALVGIAIGAAALNWKHRIEMMADIVPKIYIAVKEWLLDKFSALVGYIGEKVGQITGFFKDLYDKVVGSSYVPDLVTAIGEHFGRLEQVMVAPAQTAMSKTLDVFKGSLGSLNDIFQAAFEGGGGIGGAFKSFATNAVKNFTELIPVVGPIISQFSGAIVAGFSKIGGALKDLFGGPSAKELAGRGVVQEFEANIAKMLTDEQRLEAGNESWKQTIVVVRDAYLKLGRTEADALAAVDTLWKSSKGGADAVRDAIAPIADALREVKDASSEADAVQKNLFDAASVRLDELMDRRTTLSNLIAKELPEQEIGSLEKQWIAERDLLSDAIADQKIQMAAFGAELGTGLKDAIAQASLDPVRLRVEWTIPPLPSPTAETPETFHRGGVVLPFARAHRGLAVDDVPIIAQRGEGILSRRGMRAIGGASGLAAFNAGGGAAVNNYVTVNVDGDLNSAAARRKVANNIRQVLDDELRFRRKLSAR